ncbi:hypothetical protein [Streptosporangium sp. NPDC048865]|uniref:hypothetical protein n=1 Tax=Streptosporangium sp. NPDC048865 TaxID=3155766 RepID=UPI00342E8546
MTSTSKSPLAALSGFICFVLVAGGVSGLLREWFDWFHFMGFVRFLVPGGYEVYSYVIMIVLGLVVGVAGDAVARRGGR